MTMHLNTLRGSPAHFSVLCSSSHAHTPFHPRAQQRLPQSAQPELGGGTGNRQALGVTGFHLPIKAGGKPRGVHRSSGSAGRPTGLGRTHTGEALLGWRGLDAEVKHRRCTGRAPGQGETWGGSRTRAHGLAWLCPDLPRHLFPCQVGSSGVDSGILTPFVDMDSSKQHPAEAPP